MKGRGLYVQIDGPDYGGKTEIAERIAEYLQSLGMAVIKTYEPGGTRLGLELREILLNPKHKGMLSHLAEAFLYMADRADHMERVVIPALEEGKSVVQDRGALSTACYQGMNVPMEMVNVMNDIATRNVLPDLLILLDVDLETARERSKERGGKMDRYDQKDDAFKTRLRERYLHFASLSPDVIKVVNTSRSRDEVFSDVIILLNEKIRKANAAQQKGEKTCQKER